MCVGRTSKNIEKPQEYARFRHLEGSDLKVFVTFPMVLMHFVSDGTYRFRRAFEVTKKGCTAVFRKHYKTFETMIIYHLEVSNLKVLVTFHWKLQRLVNARKSGYRVAFGEAKMCVERISKNIVNPQEYARFRHFEGSDLKVVVTFPLVLMHVNSN